MPVAQRGHTTSPTVGTSSALAPQNEQVLTVRMLAREASSSVEKCRQRQYTPGKMTQGTLRL